MEPQRKPGAAAFIGIGRRVDPVDLRMRLQERDKRAVADTQSKTERGDPSPGAARWRTAISKVS